MIESIEITFSSSSIITQVDFVVGGGFTPRAALMKTEDEWADLNPNYPAGYIGIVSDTFIVSGGKRIYEAKLFDGEDAWADLPFFSFSTSGGGGGGSSDWGAIGGVITDQLDLIALLSTLQPKDSDLTAIAGLAPSNDDIIQRKAGAWINRTMAQLKTDLVLVKADVGLGNADNTSDANKPVSTAQAAADAQVKADLRDGVASQGDTLLKLYNLVLGANDEEYVADIAARDAYVIPHLPFSLFVIDDGDGKWAKYQATTTGAGATFVKLSDPDLLNAVMSAAAIKTAYESNPDTNAFTNALLAKLNGIEASADVTDAGNVGNAIDGTAALATPAGADKIAWWDSVAGVLKHVTYTNLLSKLDVFYLKLTGGQMTGTFGEKQGADMVAASTLDLGAATDGNFHKVTGNTTITALGTAPAGVVHETWFTGTPQLTHNGTSLILLTGANIVVAANDRVRWRSLGSGNWMMMDYIRATGSALAGGSVTLTKSSTVTSGFTDNKVLKSVSNVLEQASLISDDGTTVAIASGLSDGSNLRHYGFFARNASTGLNVDGGAWNGVDSFGRNFFGITASDLSNQWTHNRFGQRNAIATLNASTLTLNRNHYQVAVQYTDTGAVTITLPSATSCWDSTLGVGQKFIIVDKGCNANANNITVNRAGSDDVITSSVGTSGVLSINGGRMEIECISATQWKINFYA